MKNLIWDNDVCTMYDAVRDEYEEEGEGEELSEGALWEEAQERINDCFDDECANLNIDTEKQIVLMGTLERWNGGFSVYKELNTDNLADALIAAVGSFDGDDSLEIYEQNGGLFISQTGHDNPCRASILEFRGMTADIEDLDDDKQETLLKNSVPLGGYAREIYGWAEEIA